MIFSLVLRPHEAVKYNRTFFNLFFCRHSGGGAGAVQVFLWCDWFNRLGVFDVAGDCGVVWVACLFSWFYLTKDVSLF